MCPALMSGKKSRVGKQTFPAVPLPRADAPRPHLEQWSCLPQQPSLVECAGEPAHLGVEVWGLTVSGRSQCVHTRSTCTCLPSRAAPSAVSLASTSSESFGVSDASTVQGKVCRTSCWCVAHTRGFGVAPLTAEAPLLTWGGVRWGWEGVRGGRGRKLLPPSSLPQPWPLPLPWEGPSKLDPIGKLTL